MFLLGRKKAFSETLEKPPSGYGFSTTQIATAKDQDRFCEIAPQKTQRNSINTDTVIPAEQGRDSCSYFAVFDGHGEHAMAADICKSKLHDAIFDSEKVEDIGNLSSSALSAVSELNNEAELKPLNLEERECQIPSDNAIVKGFRLIHEEIVNEAVSAGKYRSGTCAACLFLPKFSFIESEVSKTKSETPGNVSVASSISDASVHGSILYPAKVAWTGDTRCIIFEWMKRRRKKSEMRLILQTTDHRVESNEKERQRIEKSINDNSARPETATSEALEKHKDSLLGRRKLARGRSFIGKRTAPDGREFGGRVLFAHAGGVSLQISRSLGDPLAARSAIHEPEILETTLDSAKSYRAVIASDGLFDVVSSRECGRIINTIASPEVASLVLAKFAKSQRSNMGLGPDDITVMVVDIPRFC